MLVLVVLLLLSWNVTETKAGPVSRGGGYSLLGLGKISCDIDGYTTGWTELLVRPT